MKNIKLKNNQITSKSIKNIKLNPWLFPYRLIAIIVAS